METRAGHAHATRLMAVSAILITVAGAAQPPNPACVIDMGSNTFRRIVGSFDNGRYVQRAIEKVTLGVGDDLARHGRISDAKLAEIAEALAAFKQACEREGAQPAVAIGTAAFREAPNGTRAVELASGLGIRMEIATETRESQLAYLAGALGKDDVAVIDNGSRTIELVAQERGIQRHRVVSLGYRLAYERFFADADDPLAAIRSFRERLLEEARHTPFMTGRSRLVGVEFGEMAALFFPSSTVEGLVLPLEELERTLAAIATSGRDAYQSLKKQKDIDRALPRLVVAATLTRAFGYSAFELTDRELGAGLIIEAGLKKPD